MISHSISLKGVTPFFILKTNCSRYIYNHGSVHSIADVNNGPGLLVLFTGLLYIRIVLVCTKIDMFIMQL
jgi:hypothetical protein